MSRLIVALVVLLSFGAQTVHAVGYVSTPLASPEPANWAYPEWFADTLWLGDHIDDESLSIIALTPLDEFEATHIPGAVQTDWPEWEIVETSDQSVVAWRSEVERMLTSLGVERSDTVVVYDGGTFYAVRIWWILHQLGHEDVRILNGGLEAWLADGKEVQSGSAEPSPAAEPYVGEPDESAVAQIAEVETAFEQGRTAFVDARSADEYADGHIPGAVNIPFTDNAEASGPKYWKNPADLREMYVSAGVLPDGSVIPYCTTGVRSAATYFALLQLGYSDVSLFTGSFKEWASDPDRPVTTGPKP